MAIAFVQRVAIVSSVANQTTTGAQGGTFTAGNLLAAIVGWSTSVAAPTDISIPSGWTAPLAMKANGAPNGGARAYYMANNPGGAQTWTWTLTPGSSTAQSWGIEILEFSGVATTTPLDLTAISNATGAAASASLDTTAATGTTASGDVLVQLVAIDRSAAGTETTDTTNSVPTTGWNVLAVTTSTNGVPNCSVSGQYNILAGTQASPRGVITSSISESWETFLLTFKAAGGANNFTQSLTGGLSFTGPTNLRIATGKGLASAGLSFTGPAHLLNALTKGLTSASLSFVGAINRLTSKTLAAAGVSFTGAISSAKVFLKALSGALSFTGPTRPGFSVGKSLAGNMSFSGAGLRNAISRGLSGTLGFVGSLAHSGGSSVPAPIINLFVVSRHTVLRLFSRLPSLTLASRKTTAIVHTRNTSLTVVTRNTSLTVRSR